MKSVLVTGANSGIGFHITKHLSVNGIHVFAGYRNKESVVSFKDLDNITPIQVDVTDQDSIHRCFRDIEKSDSTFLGLVNNAGIGEAYPFLYTTMDEFYNLFNVNVFGIHRMVLKFGELIVKNKGRIVNIGSISGILSGFAFGTYSASKHAIEAYTDSLSKEMLKFGVSVSVVEPGNYKSNMGKDAIEKLKIKMESLENNLYENEFQMFIQRFETSKSEPVSAPEPIAVADAVYHALTSTNPKIRYLVTDVKNQTDMVINKMIAELLQLNKSHKYSYSKEELYQVIDKLWDQESSELMKI